MTDTKIVDLANLPGASVASGDELPIVDVSDTSMDASGTTKNVTASGLSTAVAALLPAGSVANTALTTNPLARANHTGTQTMSTISDAGSLATLSTVDSAHITDGTITSTDISGSAAITNAQLATEAQSTIKGRAAAAGTGAVTDLTATQVRTIIDTNTTPSTQVVGDSASVGTADTLARGDHKHAWPVAADIYALAASVNTQTASYTAVLADAGKLIELNSGSANNFTVPQNSSVAFPVGTIINVTQYGAGATTIVADTNVTIRCRLTLVMKGQYSTAQLYKRATNEWVLSGDMT